VNVRWGLVTLTPGAAFGARIVILGGFGWVGQVVLGGVSRLPEFYVAVDVEADGPIPGPYSMISLGMAVVGRPELTFYSELRPISEEFVSAALAVSGLDRERLVREAPAAEEVMAAAAKWINGLRKEGRPVFLAGPAVFDGMFVHWYFMRFLGRSPFSASGAGIDLRSYWMGLNGGEWVSTRKSIIKQKLGIEGLPHTHHAGEDAAELAGVFEAVLRSRDEDPR
jgi:DNA polymerase III epsilon subunit-like protein